MSVYLPHVYPHVLAGRLEESVAVFINLHLLLELTMPKGKRIKSTSETIVCNLHDYFDRQSKKQMSTSPKLCKKTAEATWCTVNHVLLELDGRIMHNYKEVIIANACDSLT